MSVTLAGGLFRALSRLRLVSANSAPMKSIWKELAEWERDGGITGTLSASRLLIITTVWCNCLKWEVSRGIFSGVKPMQYGCAGHPTRTALHQARTGRWNACILRWWESVPLSRLKLCSNMRSVSILELSRPKRQIFIGKLNNVLKSNFGQQHMTQMAHGTGYSIITIITLATI